MPVFFDVGANDGSSMLHFSNDPNNTVYAFEPTPRMISILESRVVGRPNYIIVPKAVCDYNGFTKFKIAGQADWGCSSLFDFNDDLDKTWPGRTDFKVTESIDVEVIRLDDFIKQNGITEVEYLHVDTQGADLEVLMGLGDCLHMVKAGVIEMPSNHRVKLYKNQKYVEEDAVRFLTSNGFRVDAIESNDCFRNEVNIRFSRV